MMTDEQIQRLQALKVTGGEWVAARTDGGSGAVDGIISRSSGNFVFPDLDDDLELMAHAKLLLAEVIRLKMIVGLAGIEQPETRTRCSLGFAHHPHDWCDGNPGAGFIASPQPAKAAEQGK